MPPVGARVAGSLVTIVHKGSGRLDPGLVGGRGSGSRSSMTPASRTYLGSTSKQMRALHRPGQHALLYWRRNAAEGRAAGLLLTVSGSYVSA